VLPQSSAAARALQLSLGVVMGWFLADDLSGRLRQGCADFDVLKKINPESAKEKAQSGWLPLHYAAVHKASIEVVKKIIECYPEAVKAKDNYNTTPLHYAVANGAPDEVVQVLFKAFPEAAEVKTEAGAYPLHYAAAHAQDTDAHVLMLLKAFPAAVKEANEIGWYPLHFACQRRASNKVILALLDAYPEAAAIRDKTDQYMPLHHLIAEGRGSNEAIMAVLDAYPQAAREKMEDEGKVSWLPAQLAVCYGREVPAVAALLSAFPEALTTKDRFGYTLVELTFGWAIGPEVTALVVKADAHHKAIKDKIWNDHVEQTKGVTFPKPRGISQRDKENAARVLGAHMNSVQSDEMMANTKKAQASILATLPKKLPPPAVTDVIVVGAGLTGLSVAANFAENTGTPADLRIFERSNTVAGVWNFYGNCFSRVNISGPAYYLPTKTYTRASIMHPYHFDILEDALAVVKEYKFEDKICLLTELRAVGSKDEATGRRTVVGVQDKTVKFRSECKLLCMCTNRRLGTPFEFTFPGEDRFHGPIRRGLADDTSDMSGGGWKGKKAIIVGMGAYAVEMMRTAIERDDGVDHVTLLVRRLTTVLPRVVDWLNYIRPWDKDLRNRSYKGTRLVQKMIYDAYMLAKAPMPKQFKPDGGTGLLSDLFFLAFWHEMCDIALTEITEIHESFVMTQDGQSRNADIIIKSIGFNPNSTTDHILGKTSMCGIGLVADGLWCKGEPHIDNGMDTNTPLASSIFYSVPLFCKTVVRFWNNARLTPLLLGSNGAPQVRMNWFTLSEWVQGYRHLSNADAESDTFLREYIESVRNRFIGISSIEQYVAANILEWQLESTRLAPRGKKKEIIKYPFEAAVLEILTEEAPHLLRLKA